MSRLAAMLGPSGLASIGTGLVLNGAGIFPTDAVGLSESGRPEAVTLSDGDAFDLEIDPVAKDERIPVDALEFGTSAIRRLLECFGQANPS